MVDMYRQTSIDAWKQSVWWAKGLIFPVNFRFFCSRQEATPFVDCKVTVAGRLKANKGVNTPDVILAMSPITEKDGNSGTYTVYTTLTRIAAILCRQA